MRSVAAALLLCLVVTGCKTGGDPETVGEGKWIRDEYVPFEAMNAERGLEVFWLSKVNETTYRVVLKPGGLERIPPPYPGSKLIDSENLLISEERIYSIPEGRSFLDVWDHYEEWFHFGRPSSGPPDAPSAGTPPAPK